MSFNITDYVILREDIFEDVKCFYVLNFSYMSIEVIMRITK